MHSESIVGLASDIYEPVAVDLPLPEPSHHLDAVCCHQSHPWRTESYPPERNENVDKKSDENARKLANVPVKGKADRKKLLGYECSECRSYYTSLNLEEAKRNEIVQNCSRHRATIKPPPDSPKGTKDMPCNMYSKLFYT